MQMRAFHDANGSSSHRSVANLGPVVTPAAFTGIAPVRRFLRRT
jgi:hypothetical protein